MLVFWGVILGGAVQGREMIDNAKAARARMEALEAAITADGPDVLVVPAPEIKPSPEEIDRQRYNPTGLVEAARAYQEAVEAYKADLRTEYGPRLAFPRTAQEYEILPPSALYVHPESLAVHQKPAQGGTQ
jgi:hypothetical protein